MFPFPVLEKQENFLGALDTHVHFQVIAVALEINAVEGLEDSRGDYWIDQEQEAQHREVEG